MINCERTTDGVACIINKNMGTQNWRMEDIDSDNSESHLCKWRQNKNDYNNYINSQRRQF